MLIIGLTGGIASGKSTVSSLLSSPPHSLPLIDADLLAREVVEPGTSGFKAIVSHFGSDRILRSDGSLDRAALGEIVFNDPEDRKWLNGVIHPAVRREMVRRVMRLWLRGEWAVIVDVPLLVEAGLWRWVGEIVVVYVNERLQLTRLLARPSDPPLTPAQAKSRISAQLPLSQKLSYATQVLDNSGTQSDLSTQVDRLVKRWKAQQGGETGWWWRLCWLIPPVGLAAGAICLLQGWWRAGKRNNRRRGRGEVDRRLGGEEGESIELRERGATGRRRNTGSSVGSD